MITSIEIENFKSIGKRTKFELSDITLLYGPNSAGKSSLVLALHYLKSILCDHDLDPEYIELDGERIHLGGFSSLVHARNLSNTISIDVIMDATNGLRWVDLAEFFVQPRVYPIDENLRQLLESTRDRTIANRDRGECEIWQFPGHGQLGPLPLSFQPKFARFSVSVSWDHMSDTPRISQFSTSIDDIPILRCTPKQGYENTADAKVSPKLMTLLPAKILDFAEWVRAFESPPTISFDDAWRHPDEHIRKSIRRLGIFDHETFSTNFRKYLDDYRSLWAAIESKGTDGKVDWVKIGGKAGKRGFEWPSIGHGQPMFSVLGWNDALVYSPHSLSDEGQAFNTLMTYCGILSTTIQVGLSQTLENGFLHLGPLREHPDIGNRSGTRPHKASWLKGIQAWELILQNEGLCLDTSHWLSTETKFSAGHTLERTAVTSFAGDYDEVIELIKVEPSKARTSSSEKFGIVVRDRHGLGLQSREVGTGISQVVPVIVAVLNNPALCFVEQPELHLHPKMQLAIADLLIDRLHFWNSESESIRKRQYIVETHSEHVALRMLRRIRESSEASELVDDNDVESMPSVTPDQIAILYALPTDEGLQILRLRVDETGEFIDRWPSGFFDERAEELF